MSEFYNLLMETANSLRPSGLSESSLTTPSRKFGYRMNASKLSESTGIDIPVQFNFLSEAAQVQVTDNVLMEMFKFVTDKYNSLDFGEIERSAGDLSRFQYRDLIETNAQTLMNIYELSTDPGAKVYIDTINDINTVYRFLMNRRDKISFLYKKGNGVIQLMYTSLVAGMLYALTALINNTIRFVTVDQDADIEVLFDEIPNSQKEIHIRNIRNCARDIKSFESLVDKLYDTEKSGTPIQESVSGVVLGVMIAAGVIYLIPKIIVLIREIIYSIYYARVRIADVIGVQIELIRTNIESLETSGRGKENKKVIARQKRVVDRLEKIQKKLVRNMDAADSLTKIQVKKENAAIHVEKDSVYVSPTATDTSSLMI